MAANTDGGDESDALDALLNDSLNDYDRRQAAAEAAAVRPSSTEPPRVLSSTEDKDEEGEADHLADALADEFLSSLSGYENGEDVEVLTEQLMAQLGVSKEEMLQARQKEEAVTAAADAQDAGETAQARNVKEKGGAQGQRQAGGKGPRDMEAQMAAMLEQLAAVAEKSKKESSGDAASGETAADGAGDREAEALLNSLLSGLGDEDGLLGGGEGDDSDDGDSGEEGDDILATMLDAVFSKEMLYPSLSELRDRYPPWLAEQGDALSPADQQRFKAQHSNITAICRLYEASDRPDSKAVLDLINRMNSLGSPPEPIVKNMGIELGPDGTPQLPNLGGAQCSLM